MKIINSKIVNGKKMFLIEEPIKKLGGVIEDNQGQWKYPGQITKINSPNITMKGVNYPVLGISEQTGEQKLMFPENNYKFKSTKAVIEYPITAQAGTTVKINKDNVVKEYDRRSPEYKAMYDSGRLMSYDKSTDTYRATPLETFEVKTKAPQWLIDKRNIEKNFTKEKFVKKYLPKWSGSMGETADNLSENAQKDYDKKVNDKLANVLLKSNQKKGNKEANNLDWYNSFSEKEREIIQQSSLANKFAPAQRAYDLDVSNSTKKYNTTDVLTDADKLSQSVQGTPERFRLFPNAENNIESYVNPGMFIGSMAKGLGNVPKDIKNENYGQAALSIATPLGVGSLAGIGNPSIKQFINNIANPLAGTGDLVNNLGNKYLPNAYKLNPKALKEAQEQMLVRARPVGQDPYINMAEQLKAKQAAGEQLTWYQKNLLNPQTNPQMAAREKYFGQWFADNPSDLDFYINPGTRNFADDAQIEILKARMPKSEASKYNVKNFEDAKKLSNLHDTEFILPKDMVQQLERHSVDDLPKLIKEYNEINKPHWLKGYKEVEVPKSNFKSEIDWAKWNKEIPNNTQLMKEYNAIEKATKANGSWMKNSDGSTFQGTPEQFVNNIVNPLAGTGNLIKSKIINNLKNINYELSTIPKKINPFYQSKVNKELQIGNQWQDDWYNHPDTKKRLEDLSYEFSIPEIERIKDKNYISEMNRRNPLNLKGFTKEEINNIYKIYPLTPSHNSWDEILNRIDNKNYLTKFQTKYSKLQKILKGEERLHDGNYGVSGYNLDNTFRGERQNFVDKYSPKIKSTAIHEGNHGLTDGNDLLDYTEQKNIGKIFGEDYSIPKRNTKGEFNSYDEYLQDPTEVYARIMELRNYMKIKPNQVLDSDLFNKMIEKGIEGKTPVEKTFFKLIKNTDHFRSLFNRLPLLIPGAMGLESISQMEEKEFGGKILNTKIENGKKYFLINE